jgi:hypothetical protein
MSPAGGDDPREQEVTDALIWLRDKGVVSWTWIADETRQLHEWEHAPTVAKFVRASVDIARVNPWPGEPPLMLVESRSLGGVLRAMTSEYLCSIAATNGQVGGFLHTEVAPILQRNDRVVLYLGDFDLQRAPDRGEHASCSGTQGASADRLGPDCDHWRADCPTWPYADLEEGPPVYDRAWGAREFEAWECEALGQGTIQRLVGDALDGLLSEPLSDVLEREAEQRARVAAVLDELDE